MQERIRMDNLSKSIKLRKIWNMVEFPHQY